MARTGAEHRDRTVRAAAGLGGNWSGGGGNWSGGNWSGGGNVPPSPRHRRLRRGVAFGVAGVTLAAAAAVGSYDALQGGGSPTGHATTSANTVLSTSQITSKVSPGLVDVVSTLGDENGEAAGTGMVLTSTGEVLTNNHVIDGATSISVTDIGNGRTYKASVVGYDKTQDVAVLQLQDASGLTTVSLGNSATVSTGQSVVAIGNAEGKGGQPSVVTGSVTALNQSITASDEGSGSSEQLTGLIETNAPIEPGDSGGSLVNSAGQVIGMDTAASTSSETPTAQAANPGQQSQGQSGQSQSKRDSGLRHPDQRGGFHRGADRRGQLLRHASPRLHRLPRRRTKQHRHRLRLRLRLRHRLRRGRPRRRLRLGQ